MRHDYGKYNCYFFIRDIDEIFNLNSSTLALHKIQNIFLYKNLKSTISKRYFDADELNSIPTLQISSAQSTSPHVPTNNPSQSESRFYFKVARKSQKSKTKPSQSDPTTVTSREITNNSHSTKQIVEKKKSITKCEFKASRCADSDNSEDDDDDELILDEYGVLEYYFKFVNQKKHNDFINLWRLFLDVHVRSPIDILKIKLNRACVDITANICNHNIISMEHQLVEYILFAQTDFMLKNDLYLITTTCDADLTLHYLNSISVDKYHIVYFVPIQNSEKVYVELMELISSFCKYEKNKGRLREKSKIFNLPNEVIKKIYTFIESKRTHIEFKNEL